MAMRSTTLLSLRLSLASLASVGAVMVVCVVGLVSLRDVSLLSRSSAQQQLALVDDTEAFEVLLGQRVLLDEYLLERQPGLLRELARRRWVFQRWIARASIGADADTRTSLRQIASEYARYETQRRRALLLFEGGREDEALDIMAKEQVAFDRLLMLVEKLRAGARSSSAQNRVAAEATTLRLSHLIVVTSILGVMASLAVGFFWARRFARPITELQLGVESAEERIKVEVLPGGDLDGMADRVAAIVRRLEELDASLAEQRRRTIQSEKLSAIGEVAAKLAHEILNPLAGMKTAVQLLARSGKPKSEESLRETSNALGREIERVEVLLRRLMNYARPLAPNIEVCQVGRLLDEALDAAGPELRRLGTEVKRREEEGLPPVEVDVQLMAQAVANLIRNAAQAMQGGAVEVRAFRRSQASPSSPESALRRGQLCVEVIDRGPGIAPEDEAKLFHPFFTTKTGGNGLGLAISQNIVLEHGGEIRGRNREGGGAVFQVSIPLLR